MPSDLLKVTGLWKSTDKNNRTVLSGNLNGNVRVVIFENQYKEQGDNKPDYEMFLQKNEKKDGGDSG